MPGHKVHAYLDRHWFGRVYWRIHRGMDLAWVFHRRGHRKYWHDWVSAKILAVQLYPNDSNAVEAAMLHLAADETCSANPSFRRLLEIYADDELKERKKLRKTEKRARKKIGRGKKKKIEFEALMERDLKKMMEIHRLMQRLYCYCPDYKPDSE